MSGEGSEDFEEYIALEYRAKEVKEIPLSELQGLYRRAIQELLEKHAEFEDFKCKFYNGMSFSR
jgi:hypothetical protein